MPPLSSLALSSALDEEARQSFFEQFDFSATRSVVDALRLVLEKVCLEGETQEQDRILASFATRYNATNSSDPLVKAFHGEATHKLVYAAVLLNTDLHGVRDKKHRRMRRSDFVENTLSVVSNDAVSKEEGTLIVQFLEVIYDDIATKPLMNIADTRRPPQRNSSSRRSWAFSLRRSSKEIAFHHKVQTYIYFYFLSLSFQGRILF